MILDHHITVAQAAAVINVAIILVQLTYPLLITVVAVGILKRQTNAATWSVFGRLIHKSFWPRILRADTSSGIKVDKRIRLASLLSIFAAVVLAIAAAITPLGLHAALRLDESDGTSFSYVKDDSPLGRATQSRSGYVSSRLCGGILAASCPGSDDGVTVVVNATGEYGLTDPDRPDASVTSGIASNITDIFTSGTDGDQSTVASALDIQYRSFINYNNQTKPGDSENAQWIDSGHPRTQGQFRYFQSFILDEKTQAVEGLIISTGESPGIGFRNHTLPPGSELGYTWSEDILWLEPDTECTNLNITYDYTLPPPLKSSNIPANARLTDRGGFINLPHEFPILDLNNTQADPQLLARSWKGAVLTNEFVVKVLDETRAGMSLGKEYTVNDYSAFSLGRVTPNQVSFSPFGTANVAAGEYHPNLPGTLSSLYSQNATFNISLNTFDVAISLQGYAGGDPLNITTAAYVGGLMLGVGAMVDSSGDPSSSADQTQLGLNPGTNWSQPLYSCSSVVRASIKTVTFKLNGTASISNLEIESVEPVKSSRTWAMENPGSSMYLLTPFWGPIAASRAGVAGIQTINRDHFFLPAGGISVSSVATLEESDAVAGLKAPIAALASVYSTASTSTLGAPDLSGGSNWLLFQKWAELGKKPETAGRIIDYIWTDMMANAVVGSKSVLSTKDPKVSLQEAEMPAARYVASITYDWRYAIPALVFAAIYGCLFLFSILLFVFRRLSFGVLRFMLNQTAAGRSMTTERSQAALEVDFAKTRDWAHARGGEMVRVGKDSLNPKPVSTQEDYRYHQVENKQGVHATTSSL